MSLSNHLLNKTGKVYTKVKGAVNDFGEAAFTLSESVDEVEIAFQPVRDDIEFTLHGTTYVASHVAYCNHREDIAPGDILEVESIQYRILGVQNDGGRNHHLRLYVVIP